MKTCIATLRSTSPYSQSRAYHDTEKKNKESPDEFEKRCWREKAHCNSKGKLTIPAISFKACLQSASKYVGDKIRGKGMKAWSEKFRSGVLVDQDLVLPETKEKVAGEWVHCHANGVRGSGKRVYRCFPVVPEWSGEVTFHILDDEITEEIFVKHLKQAGLFIGLGRWRPENGGQNGRFIVEEHAWSENEA